MKSVKEINTKVQGILEDSKPYMSRINVQYACTDLLAANDEMQSYFAVDGYDTNKLDDLKQVVANNYIRLEYIISEFDNVYEKQYLKRNRLKVLNARLLSLAKDKELDVIKRQEALRHLSYVTPAYLRISDIDVQLEDELLVEAETFAGDNGTVV